MLTPRGIWKDTKAISVMYDVLLFITLISLSGVVLTPAFQSTILTETCIEKHRENIADKALHTFLVTTTENFTYRMMGNLIDDAVAGIGINTSSKNSLYHMITSWVLGHEQHHKTYAQLLSENLGCQFKIPLHQNKSFKLNIFTRDFEIQLQKEIHQFFSSYLQDKYRFNVTAWWHPIKGIPFGGSIHVGPTPPNISCYVAKTYISIPYTPMITLKNTKIVFSPYWITQVLFNQSQGNISTVENITKIINCYVSQNTSNCNITLVKTSLTENVTQLLKEFLFEGIKTVDGVIVFPGVISIVIDYGFNQFRAAVETMTEEMISAAIGEGLGTFNEVLMNLTNNSASPITSMFQKNIIDTLSQHLGETVNSFDEGLTLLYHSIKTSINSFIEPALQSSAYHLVESILNHTSSIRKPEIIENMIVQLLFDHTSITKAVIVLTVWEART